MVSFKAKNNSSNLKLPNDSVFVVESVLESRKSGSSFEYLVKFVEYPENEACWESIHHMDESTILYRYVLNNAVLSFNNPCQKLFSMHSALDQKLSFSASTFAAFTSE